MEVESRLISTAATVLGVGGAIPLVVELVGEKRTGLWLAAWGRRLTSWLGEIPRYSRGPRTYFSLLLWAPYALPVWFALRTVARTTRFQRFVQALDEFWEFNQRLFEFLVRWTRRWAVLVAAILAALAVTIVAAVISLGLRLPMAGASDLVDRVALIVLLLATAVVLSVGLGLLLLLGTIRVVNVASRRLLSEDSLRSTLWASAAAVFLAFWLQVVSIWI